MMEKLKNQLFKIIVLSCEQFNLRSLAGKFAYKIAVSCHLKKNYRDSIVYYQKTLNTKGVWKEKIHAAIADSYFHLGQMLDCLNSLEVAIKNNLDDEQINGLEQYIKTRIIDWVFSEKSDKAHKVIQVATDIWPMDMEKSIQKKRFRL